MPANRVQIAQREQLAGDLDVSFKSPNANDVLVLSGGPIDGAYGIGFLDGWNKSIDEPQPKFRIVTGISAGALMATPAFLGEAKDYEQLVQRYLKLRDQDVFSRRFLPALLWSDSLATTDPLAKLLREEITCEVINRVAYEFTQHRRHLYVGTVDLDAGIFKIWDLTRLAASDGPACREKYCEILRASAAIPVFFQPVFINEHMHVDGGTCEKLFLRDWILHVKKAYKKAVTEQPGMMAPTVYVIVNGRIHPDGECVRDRLIPVAMRSFNVNQSAQKISNLTEVWAITQIEDPKLGFKYIAVPDELRKPPSHGFFDPNVLHFLYVEGKKAAISPIAWKTEPPDGDDDPIVKALRSWIDKEK
ncbi:MAG: patatin-like phospholipase family protein [Tepidisphaeraceae bacterium]